MKSALLGPLLSIVLSPVALSQTLQEYCSSSNTNGFVVDFAGYGDSIYATGFFTTACGESVAHIARWEGNSLVPSNALLPDAGHSLRVIDGNLIAATYQDAIDSNYLSAFNGSFSFRFLHGVYLTTASGFSELPNIYDVVEYQDQIYICGEFDRAGGQPIQGIARWTGTRWDSVGGGFSGFIPGSAPLLFPHVLYVHDGLLYAGGNFRFAGGETVNGIAVWDGSSWSPMGEGFNRTVLGIAFFDGQLYVVGDFTATASGSTPLNRLARWNGTAWESPGFGFTESSPSDYIFVHTLEVHDDALYILGGLKQVQADGGLAEPCGGVVRFDGSTVERFDGGVANVDLEAFHARGPKDILLGGGVFGQGWVGGLTLPSSLPSSSLEEASEQGLFHPNPSRGHTQWSGEEALDDLALWSLDGRCLQRWNTSIAPQSPIRLDRHPPGCYLLRWQQHGRIGQQRLLLLD
jgi:hypothetical protein